jgi:glycosyltransferase involved in cell wall biosynthesis
MSAPLSFSVVIPTYNRAHLIPETLNSVFEQTYPHYEVIVVDNCSSDNTCEVLRPHIDSGRIRFIQHDKNYERARSRNTGMEHANGDYVTFLDSDDFMYPTNLADAADFVNAHPELKCFHNLYELVDSRRRVIKRYRFPSLDDRIAAIVSGNFMSCIGDFIHREIYSKFRFDLNPDLTGAEDWEFWLRVFAEYRVGRINKYNNGIQHHAAQTVNSRHFDSLERGYLYMFKKFRSDELLTKVFGKYINRIEANSYMYLATLANTTANFDDARRFLTLARASDPTITFSIRFLNTLRRTLLRMKIKV